MNRRDFMQGTAAISAVSFGGALPSSLPNVSTQNSRSYWVEAVKQVSYPVLHALSEQKLKALMPVEAPHGNAQERRQFTHLEAFGRLLSGIAPWLESGATSGPEGELRSQFCEWARIGLESATNPKSPDFMNFHHGAQPVVDTAFLALGIIRAPNELWRKLNNQTQANVIAALQSSRSILPGYNNWLLFSAMVEATLSFMGARWDPMRVDYAIRTMDTWYKGDGIYGDGPFFHWDYYNSFVIHPMLLNILQVIGEVSPRWHSFQPVMLTRSRRYAEILERLISPEATFPPIGRSLCYRFGAFHLLSEVSLRRQLPDNLYPQQVRSALTAVMRRMLSAPGTFDADGWLNVGFYGHQPEIAESYISTGSCYLCSAAWLPLGLPPNDPFWSAPSAKWTSQQVWDGEPIPPDHAIGV